MLTHKVVIVSFSHFIFFLSIPFVNLTVDVFLKYTFPLGRVGVYENIQYLKEKELEAERLFSRLFNDLGMRWQESVWGARNTVESYISGLVTNVLWGYDQEELDERKLRKREKFTNNYKNVYMYISDYLKLRRRSKIEDEATKFGFR